MIFSHCRTGEEDPKISHCFNPVTVGELFSGFGEWIFQVIIDLIFHHVQGRCCNGCCWKRLQECVCPRVSEVQRISFSTTRKISETMSYELYIFKEDCLAAEAMFEEGESVGRMPHKKNSY